MTAWPCCTRSAACDEPGGTNEWLEKYIFPGGYSPALSEVLPHIEHSGLWVTDIEVLRLHYAQTLRHWRRRFAANRAAIASILRRAVLPDVGVLSRRLRAFVPHVGQMNFQIQLSPSVDTLPITRDYMAEEEQAARARAQPLAEAAAARRDARSDAGEGGS